MSSSMLIGLWILVIAGVLAAYRLLAGWRLRLPTEADDLIFASTRDGWRLALWHFLPETETGASHRHLPVVLCHGLQANRFNLDFTPERSLARCLREAGFEVFVAELRGCGASKAQPGATHGGFDAHLREDLPAILTKVEAQTGCSRCLWVGHSMGGMLAYAASGRSEGEGLAAFVAVGSPGTFAHHPARLARLAQIALRLFPRGIRLRGLLRWLAPLSGWLGAFPAGDAVNMKNLEGRTIRRIVFNLLGDLPADHLRTFERWLRAGTFCSLETGEDYLESLARSRIPALLLAGGGDRLVPVAAVQAAADALGDRAQMKILGLATGYAVDYGHGDLLLGRRAPAEVYPRILDFLVARDDAEKIGR